MALPILVARDVHFVTFAVLSHLQWNPIETWLRKQSRKKNDSRDTWQILAEQNKIFVFRGI